METITLAGRAVFILAMTMYLGACATKAPSQVHAQAGDSGRTGPAQAFYTFVVENPVGTTAELGDSPKQAVSVDSEYVSGLGETCKRGSQAGTTPEQPRLRVTVCQGSDGKWRPVQDLAPNTHTGKGAQRQ